MEAAGPQAKFMHCLPAERGVECTDGVMESGEKGAGVCTACCVVSRVPGAPHRPAHRALTSVESASIYPILDILNIMHHLRRGVDRLGRGREPHARSERDHDPRHGSVLESENEPFLVISEISAHLEHTVGDAAPRSLLHHCPAPGRRVHTVTLSPHLLLQHHQSTRSYRIKKQKSTHICLLEQICKVRGDVLGVAGLRGGLLRRRRRRLVHGVVVGGARGAVGLGRLLRVLRRLLGSVDGGPLPVGLRVRALARGCVVGLLGAGWRGWWRRPWRRVRLVVGARGVGPRRWGRSGLLGAGHLKVWHLVRKALCVAGAL